VEQVAKDVDLILVVGSQNSSNSNRLVELAQRLNRKAKLIDSANDIDPKWLEGVSRIGLTAGASAPEVLVEQVSERLANFGFTDQRDLDLIREDVRFTLPSRAPVDRARAAPLTAGRVASKEFCMVLPGREVSRRNPPVPGSSAVVAAQKWPGDSPQHKERTLAVKIVRQPNKIAIMGAPSSAAAFLPGSEKAPAALRAAGIVERLQSIGYEVTDLGDCFPRLFADDEEHKRARNIPEIVASLHDLKPRAEIGLKSGALVLVLGGDCTQIIALLTAARRYYKHVNLLWFDRDADLNTPASTPSGRLDGMGLASIIGKGSPELVRFWGEPPLVREPDALIYGLQRIESTRS